MKTKLLFIFACTFMFGQDSLSQDLKLKSAVITFNPAKIAKNTTGINLGVFDSYQKQKINGINLQINPITLLYPLLPQAIPVPSEDEVTVILNGIHISTGGMMDGAKLNGLGISIYHHARVTNGFSANLFNNTSGILNGIHVSGAANNSEKGAGITFAFMGNYSEKFTGLQIGGFNEAKQMKGLQIGFVNKSENLKGIQVGIVNNNKNGRNFQLGFWNKNTKRTLPILNF
ncbi:LA_2272 family surface repeat-containing protein [Kaistella sp.]|uniref:LA_2272 family surface repeat-containing protein n=1 Tax=Kaistella sp. TaxID=2782235 RepID=UPI003C357242